MSMNINTSTRPGLSKLHVPHSVAAKDGFAQNSSTDATSSLQLQRQQARADIHPLFSGGTQAAGTGTAESSIDIETLNSRIRDLEQNGESFDGQLDGLREQRDDLIKAFTGNSSAESYDVDVVGQAQARGTTYNHEVTQLNKNHMFQNMHRPADSQIPYVNAVKELPWELDAVNGRVDKLVSTQDLSVDAAVVIAMTERRGEFSFNGLGFKPFTYTQPSIQGDWQAGFAVRAGRAGPEIEAWALAQTSDASNTLITLTANNDDVTILQNDVGQIVVRDNTGAAADQLFDSSGSDRVVILGGNGNDRITIDPSVTNSMVVAGGAGDDYLFGGNGNDILIGGDGVDLIRGEGGSDIVIGGQGDDNIEGGAGGDLIRGGSGADYVSGGNGNDIVQGGSGRDALYGGYGEDLITGGVANDYIDGGANSDLLDGESGDDQVSGGSGDDTINGGAGRDTLIGASGADTYADSTFGDHVIRESTESRGGQFASSTIVEIDKSIGNVGDYVASGERQEFRTRVADDLETLRSLESGQRMLTHLADIEERTGNSVSIRELDGAQDRMTLPNGEVVSTENGFAYTGVSRTNWATQYGQAATTGVDSTVFYNPSVNIPLSEASGRENVPPVVVLFHEFSHAYNQTSGTGILGAFNAPGSADSTNPSNPNSVGNVERQAVGLSISVDHDNDTSTPEVERANTTEQAAENDLRKELGIGDRVSYR